MGIHDVAVTRSESEALREAAARTRSQRRGYKAHEEHREKTGQNLQNFTGSKHSVHFVNPVDRSEVGDRISSVPAFLIIIGWELRLSFPV